MESSHPVADYICVAQRDQLERVLVALLEDSSGLAERIETLFLRDDPNALAPRLAAQIEALAAATERLSAREGFVVARSLDWLVSDIATLVETSDQAAFELCDRLCRLIDPLLSRLDGPISILGEALKRACGLWLETAAAVRKAGDERDWIAMALAIIQTDTYGIAAGIGSQLGILLKDSELSRLATRVEDSLGDRQSPGPLVSQPSALLGDLGIALRDPELVEKALLLVSPHPDHIQVAGLVDRLLEIGAAKAALGWLGDDSPMRELDCLAARRRAFEILDDQVQLLQVLDLEFTVAPNRSTMRRVLDRLSADAAASFAEATAKSCHELEPLANALEILDELGETKAMAELIIERSDELSGAVAARLRPLIERLGDGFPDATTLALRALVLGAVGIEAIDEATLSRDLAKLEALSSRIDDLEPSHSEFLERYAAARSGDASIAEISDEAE